MRLPLVLAILAVAASASAQSGAGYRVTFTATWSATSHPAMFPANAHFSPVAGAAHDATVALWAPGALASPGIEQMAESGATTLLAGEIDALGGAAGPIRRSPAIDSPGQTDATVDVSDAHPLVSFVTMVAPSPDWFVGVHGLDLRDGAGGWRESVVVELLAYDAGTDSGATYTAPDLDTQPRAPIARITTAPFESATPLGTLTFTRLTVATADAPGAAALRLDVASPARAGATLRIDAPADADVTVELFALDGRRVATLADGRGGARSVVLPTLPAGVYVLRAVSGAERVVRLVTLVR
jgi:hypothetical protein